MRTTIIVLGLLVLVAVIVAKQVSEKNRAKKLKTEVKAGWSHPGFDKHPITMFNCRSQPGIDPTLGSHVVSEGTVDFPIQCGRLWDYKRSFLDNILKKTEELDEDERIVGGEESWENMWPWLAAIGKKQDGAKCGAALITDQFLLTAAHCIKEKSFRPCEWNVRLGEHNLLVHEGRHIDRDVEMIWIHPEYNSSTIEHDIAVIKLVDPVDFYSSLWVKPICMPYERLPPESICYVAGWGMTSYQGSTSDTVRHVDVSVFSDSYCEACYGHEFKAGGMFCAGSQQGGKDTCQGDSGGPLVCYNEVTDRWIGYGIVSWGHGCGSFLYPGIYSSVFHYKDWINDIIDTYGF